MRRKVGITALALPHLLKAHALVQCFDLQHRNGSHQQDSDYRLLLFSIEPCLLRPTHKRRGRALQQVQLVFKVG